MIDDGLALEQAEKKAEVGETTQTPDAQPGKLLNPMFEFKFHVIEWKQH